MDCRDKPGNDGGGGFFTLFLGERPAPFTSARSGSMGKAGSCRIVIVGTKPGGPAGT